MTSGSKRDGSPLHSAKSSPTVRRLETEKPKAKQPAKHSAKKSGKAQQAPVKRKPAATKQHSEASLSKRDTGSSKRVSAPAKKVAAPAPSKRNTGPAKRVSAPAASRSNTASGKKVAAPANTKKLNTAPKKATIAQKSVSKPVTKGVSKPGKKPQGTKGGFLDFFKAHIKVMLPVAIVLVLIVFGGVYDLFANFGKVHTGVKVQGIDVGGLTKEEASKKLTDELSATVAEGRVTVYTTESYASEDGASLISQEAQEGVAYADEVSAASDIDGDGSSDKWTITSDSIGTSPDGDAMAEEAFAIGRRSLDFPLERIKAFFGSFDLSGIIKCDGDLMNALGDEINDAYGKETKNSRLKFSSSGTVTVREGHDGWRVDTSELLSRIGVAVFNQSTPAVLVPMVTETRNITPQTAQSLATSVNSAISQDVTVTYGNNTWTLKSSDLCGLLGQVVLEPDEEMVIGGGTESKTKASEVPSGQTLYDTKAGTDSASGWKLQAYVDQEEADAYLVDILGKKARGGAKNAKFDTSDGETVSIIPSENGTGPDRAAAEIQLQNILFGTDGNRTISLVDTTIVPELTTEEAEAMGIKERLATWSIPLTGTDARIHNITLLCKLIDGSIVKPGDSWSFNGTTGERTAEKGFEKAAVIVNGRHEDQLGGGVCQVATCVFNAACYSGLGIQSRVNHDFYIPAYDDYGFCDATVSWDEPDLIWVNDMDNSILLTASTDSGDVVVSLWGTKDGREVTCDRGEWKEGTKYTTIKEYDDELPAGEEEITQSGVDGRSITVHYLVEKDGQVLHDINFKSEYVAQNEIISVGTMSSGDDSESESEDESESEEDSE